MKVQKRSFDDVLSDFQKATGASHVVEGEGCFFYRATKQCSNHEGSVAPEINRTVMFVPAAEGVDEELAEALGDADAFTRSLTFQYDAMPTWNANFEGNWLSSPDDGWAVLEGTFVQEQDEFGDDALGAIIATWPVEGGHALALLDDGEKARRAVVTMMGLETWPKDDDWESATGWYGE